MPKNTKVQDLKINILTEAQYDAAVREEVIGDYELSLLTDVVDKAIQVKSLPTASAEELNNIYQYVGETDVNYTNGYFYKCISGGSVDAIEVSTMPTASAEETGKLYKYVGETNANYTNGCYYKSQGTLVGDDWSTDTHYVYSWVEVVVGDTGVSQVSTMPTASSEELGNIYQYTGETSSEYTNGSYYKCISYQYAGSWDEESTTVYSWKELEHIETNDAYSWVQLNVQPSSGGSPLPDQTGNAGKVLGTDGTNASWVNKTTVTMRKWEE